MNGFRDKIAIVTGGASGMGRALCEELGRRGTVVVVSDLHMEGAKNVSQRITAAGGRARAIHLDVTSEPDVSGLVHTVVSEEGRLDYIFNNAGIAIVGEVRDMNLDHWRRILDINLRGVIYGTAAAYQVMVKQGFGHIVNIASLAGLIPLAGITAYAVTKHAVVGLSTSLRIEAADLGVKVSVVCPGLIKTNIIDSATYLKLDKERLLDLSPRKGLDVDLAARTILEGVARNRPIIAFPFGARLLWWLYRHFPRVLEPFGRRGMRKLRTARTDDLNS
jgi:NAD(P)-dependent dehydrogenase (short-subunit alcohol dehydrogenase family)